MIKLPNFTIQQIQRIKLEPDEILVIQTDVKDQSHIARINEQLKNALNSNKVLFISDTTKLNVIKQI